MRRYDNMAISGSDFKKIQELEKQFLEECERITLECELEGYPSHGSNYGLRTEFVREYYNSEIESILAKYEE